MWLQVLSNHLKSKNLLAKFATPNPFPQSPAHTPLSCLILYINGQSIDKALKFWTNSKILGFNVLHQTSCQIGKKQILQLFFHSIFKHFLVNMSTHSKFQLELTSIFSNIKNKCLTCPVPESASLYIKIDMNLEHHYIYTSAQTKIEKHAFIFTPNKAYMAMSLNLNKS